MIFGSLFCLLYIQTQNIDITFSDSNTTQLWPKIYIDRKRPSLHKCVVLCYICSNLYSFFVTISHSVWGPFPGAQTLSDIKSLGAAHKLIHLGPAPGVSAGTSTYWHTAQCTLTRHHLLPGILLPASRSPRPPSVTMSGPPLSVQVIMQQEWSRTVAWNREQHYIFGWHQDLDISLISKEASLQS